MNHVEEEQLKKNLSSNMRYLRLSRTPHISQTMLAKKLGVTQKSISRYETAAILPPIHILMAMADYFDLTLEDLLSEKLQNKKGMNTNE